MLKANENSFVVERGKEHDAICEMGNKAMLDFASY